MIETSKHNQQFDIGDLVNVGAEGEQNFYNHRKNGIITETVEAKTLVYYAVYWPDGETQIIFSGALRHAGNKKFDPHR
jgi:small-conductance mechanosensitive channel